jgi:hypothetical protein
MAKFRYTIEFDANSKADALNRIAMSSFVSSISASKLGQIHGPKYKGGWRATHDARFVKPGNEFGGFYKSPYLEGSDCTYDAIGPVFRTRKEAEKRIRIHMQIGPTHGWSPKRKDYTIHKVLP